MLRTAVLALVIVACRRGDVEVEEPEVEQAVVHARVGDPGSNGARDDAADPARPPPIAVELEVTSRVIEARRDPKLGTTLVTVAAGANEGVRLDWIGSIVDAAGAVVGTFTVIEVKARTTVGASSLPPNQVEGKRVRLATPPPAPP